MVVLEKEYSNILYGGGEHSESSLFTVPKLIGILCPSRVQNKLFSSPFAAPHKQDNNTRMALDIFSAKWDLLRIRTKYTSADQDGFHNLRSHYKDAFPSDDISSKESTHVLCHSDTSHKIPRLSTESCAQRLEEAFKPEGTKPHELISMYNHVMLLLGNFHSLRGMKYPDDPLALFTLTVHGVIADMLKHPVNAETETRLLALIQFVKNCGNIHSPVRIVCDGDTNKQLPETLTKVADALGNMRQLVTKVRADEELGSKLRRLGTAGCNLVDIVFAYLSVFASSSAVPSHSVLAFHHDTVWSVPRVDRFWESGSSSPPLRCASPIHRWCTEH